MTPYMDLTNPLQNYILPVMENINQQIQSFDLTNRFAVINIMDLFGYTIGRLNYGLEGKNYPDYPEFNWIIDISFLYDQYVRPLLNIFDNNALEEIKNDYPMKIIDILNSASTMVANVFINTNGINTDKYTNGDIYNFIAIVYGDHFKRYLDYAGQILINRNDIVDKLKILDAMSKCTARLGYGNQSEYDGVYNYG